MDPQDIEKKPATKAMKIYRTTIVGMLGAFAILSSGNGGAIAQSSKRSDLSFYMTSKGNRLALEAAKALAAQDCKGKVRVEAKKPGKKGGFVAFNCPSDEWSVIIRFQRLPGGRLLPGKFDYAG